MTTTDPIMGPWIRHRLRTDGITLDSPLGDTLDAIMSALTAVPYDTLIKLRDRIETAKIAAGGDRNDWGMLPHQQEAMSAAMGLPVG